MSADHSRNVLSMFRRLVVIGLVVSLGSLGLGCGTSYPRYSNGHTHECDLPDAPADKFEVRGVYTETHSEILGKSGFAHREIRWSGGDWTYLGMDDDSPFEACQQRRLDEATKATTTTKASTVDIDRCRTAMQEVKRVLYTSDDNVFDSAFRVTLRVCGNRRTWLSVAKAEGASIDGMLTAACMLNKNTAVCRN